jgi:hypothetical protein
MYNTMNHFPKEHHKSILLRAYPLALKDDRFHALIGNTQQNESQKVFWRSLEQTDSLQEGSFSYPVDTVSKSGPNEATASFLSPPSVDSYFGSEATSVKVPHMDVANSIKYLLSLYRRQDRNVC